MVDKTKYKEEIADWLKYYKFVLVCTKCNRMYGSDANKKGHCANCISKLKRLNWNGLRKISAREDFEV
jgi:rRNA maturation endonuclease Nob1